MKFAKQIYANYRPGQRSLNFFGQFLSPATTIRLLLPVNRGLVANYAIKVMIRITDHGQHLHPVGKEKTKNQLRYLLKQRKRALNKTGRHQPVSLPRYLPGGLTYSNNLFLKNIGNAYDSFLNLSIRCREQLTT